MSNYHKFKRGDKIQSQFGSKGTVIRSYTDENGNIIVLVKMSSGNEVKYDQDVIKFDTSQFKEVNNRKLGNKCPVCGNKWKVTRFGTKEWYDCNTCKKTAEELTDSQYKGLYSKAVEEEDDFLNYDTDPLGWFKP